MTDQPENPLVFPTIMQLGNRVLSEGGMELRDYIAIHAGVGADGVPATYAKVLMGENFPGAEAEVSERIAWWMTAEAKYRYAFADAMLRERGK